MKYLIFQSLSIHTHMMCGLTQSLDKHTCIVNESFFGKDTPKSRAAKVRKHVYIATSSINHTHSKIPKQV